MVVKGGSLSLYFGWRGEAMLAKESAHRRRNSTPFLRVEQCVGECAGVLKKGEGGRW